MLPLVTLGSESECVSLSFRQALAQDQLKALRKFMGAASLPLKLCSTFVSDHSIDNSMWCCPP